MGGREILTLSNPYIGLPSVETDVLRTKLIFVKSMIS